MKPTDKKLIYYGPHACQKCDPKGLLGTMIVRAEYKGKVFQFNFTHDSHYPNHVWKKHSCTETSK